MASSSADLVIGQLISLVQSEASSLSRVPEEVKEMKLLLASMRSFLQDSYHGAAGIISQTQKDWVKNVRDLAYEAEDIIDEFTYHERKQQQWRGNNFKRFFQRTRHLQACLCVRHQVAAKLQDINARMKSITERAHQFGVEQHEVRDSSRYDPNWKNRLSESSLFFKDEDLVGIKKAQYELLGWLMDEELRRSVISVVGMGGSGKTTLVANTFNKKSVKQHFDFCSWITVSQQYAIEDLFRSMVKEIYKQRCDQEFPTSSVDTMTYRVLVETLVQYLESRRYLIVLDDVWTKQFWQEISIAFPEGLRGSRIMVTSRREDVAPIQSGFVSHIYLIQPLREDEAWQLFRNKTFPNELGVCPPHLDSLARNLVEKCQGLPLAIAALGGLMSSKKSTAEWKRVHDNLKWELSNNADLELVKTISLLSYQDLSFQLKHCFLYCCIFPEDYVISRKRLIRLWMAEGFLEEVNDAPPEAVAESYLMELINRSLLQVIERNPEWRPRRFKMHDLIREFAISMSKEEKLVAVLSDGEKGEESGIRRCSIELKDKELKLGNGTAPQLRSLIVFVVGEVSKSSFNKLPSGFKLLRVLDLERAPIDELPSEFGHLFNLRYLNLNRTQVKVIPKSIGKLFNLQTLLLKRTKIEILPDEIVKLHNLRYLLASYLEATEIDPSLEIIKSIYVPTNICKMKSLQVLTDVNVNGSLAIKLKEMTQLRKLGLFGLKEDDEQGLCSSIERMKPLQSLFLCSAAEVPLRVNALPSAPPCLEMLYLHGKLDKVPHWFNSLLNLKRLSLAWSKLREDHILSHLQSLPNLLSLGLLNDAFQGERLCFVEGFQKLQFLRIRGCCQLKEIMMEKGVMPGLQELHLLRCKELRRLPYGWEHLNHLKKVILYDVSDELVQSICGNGNGHLPATPYILFTRIDDDEEGGKSKWAHKILN